MAKIAQEYEASMSSTAFINKSDTKEMKEWQKKGLPVQEMMSLEKVGTYVIHQNAYKSMIIRLDTLKKGSGSDSNAEAKSSPAKDLQDLYKRIAVDSLIASLYRDATIITSDSYVPPIEDFMI
jgi:hypothetical protein